HSPGWTGHSREAITRRAKPSRGGDAKPRVSAEIAGLPNDVFRRGRTFMTDALTSNPAPLFRFSGVQSLTAITCLACLFTFGIESGMHVATAATTFVFCSLGDLSGTERG